MKNIAIINNVGGLEINIGNTPDSFLKNQGYTYIGLDNIIKNENIDKFFNLEFSQIKRVVIKNKISLKKDEYFKSKDLDIYFKLIEYETTKEDTKLVDYLFYKIEDDLDEIIEFVNNITSENYPDRSNKVSVITKGQNGFRLNNCDIKTLDLDVKTMYNDDFQEVNDTIVNKLNNESKGIVMLHGEPGTGKTNYIKHLTTLVNKDFIFIPSNFIHYLTDPSILEFLLGNTNKILVLEDSENYIKERGKAASDAVSTLLNLSDGIMSDILKMQIICTFNDKISNIDSALLRQGRLIAEYEFKELTRDKATTLCGNLGVKKLPEKLTLASIFNAKEKEFKSKVERSKIGFSR